MTKIGRVLLAGPRVHGYKTDLWTLPRIAEVIHRATGVRYHSGHVWRILQSMNGSRQRPTTRAIERNEKEIANWKQTAWRRVRKTAKQE